jgi:hypothetical protein
MGHSFQTVLSHVLDARDTYPSEIVPIMDRLRVTDRMRIYDKSVGSE